MKKPPAPACPEIVDPVPVALLPATPLLLYEKAEPARVAVAPAYVPVRVTVAVGALPEVTPGVAFESM